MGLLTIIRKNRLKEKEMRCLFLGLDNAGKTTILNTLNHLPITTISPTLGFTISTYSHLPPYTLTIWDVGGQGSLRPYWRNYFEGTDAVVWVVDSSDRARGGVGGEGKKELWALLGEERLAGATLLIFANKQDLKGSMTVEEISEALDLPSLTSHTYRIQPCSAYTGENLTEGLEWLVKEVAGRVYYGSVREDEAVEGKSRGGGGVAVMDPAGQGLSTVQQQVEPSREAVTIQAPPQLSTAQSQPPPVPSSFTQTTVPVRSPRPVAPPASASSNQPNAAPRPTRPQQQYPPPYKVQERGSSRKLMIGDWTIETVKKPILSSKELDKVAETIDIPLPEITFGNNSLTLKHATSSDSPSLVLSFATLSALGQVATGDGWEDRIGGGVQVAVAEQWNKTRVSQPAYLSDTPIPSQPIKPFDWTYSTVYPGEVSAGQTWTPTEESIPMTLLARQDPVLDQILFYDDVPLFEDELHDNGESIMNVRIRVMPHCFFILLRLLVRVDNVLFRQHDVRVYHAFGGDTIVREVTGREVPYDEVKNRLESKEDMMPLTNPDWVVPQLASLRSRSLSQTGKPWPGLEGRKEVLRFGEDALGGVTDRLSAVGI